MLQAMQGLNPFAPAGQQQPEPSAATGKVRYVPSPDKLPPLTPEAFDAMFPGKPNGAKRQKAAQR